MGKKLDFVEFVSGEMGWDDVEMLCGRAEEIAHDPAHREAYDIVTARAVAALRLLSELCLPFVRVGGTFLAMKGPAVTEELEPAQSAVRPTRQAQSGSQHPANAAPNADCTHQPPMQHSLESDRAHARSAQDVHKYPHESPIPQ